MYQKAARLIRLNKLVFFVENSGNKKKIDIKILKILEYSIKQMIHSPLSTSKGSRAGST